jgi:hypothetical protein
MIHGNSDEVYYDRIIFTNYENALCNAKHTTHN